MSRRQRVVDLDPEDPTQQLDDGGEVEPLAIEAQPASEAEADLDRAATETFSERGGAEGEEKALVVDAPIDAYIQESEEARRERDTGELYGVRTPPAADPSLGAPEDRDGFDGAPRGENWLESLEEHAAEMGPVPEVEVVIVDDSPGDPYRGHQATERDRPVADKGAGGPGGR
jgi:hypothetical protein